MELSPNPMFPSGPSSDDAQQASVSPDKTPPMAHLPEYGEKTEGLDETTNEVSERALLAAMNIDDDKQLLDDIFDGTVQPGAIYQVDIEAGSLSSGLYQLRISGGVHSEVRKLLVTE